MGGGINLMFHVGSALALVLLVHLVLEFKRQRDLMRELLRGLRPGVGRARVYVETPAGFCTRLAKALDIEVQGDTPSNMPPRKIDPRPLMELFLNSGIDLLRWAGSTLEIHSRGVAPATHAWQEKLANALGDGVDIKITGDGT